MAFDPEKFIADNPDPEAIPPEAPAIPMTDRAIAAGKYALKNLTIPGLVAQGANAVWNDPAGSLQTADDAVRSAANTITFGGADRLAGYMNSGGPQTMSGLITGQKPLTYDEAVNAEVAKSATARERSPTASVVGDVAGSVALPGLGAESLAARYGGGALARALAYGGTGAVTGAAQGAGNTYTGKPSDYLLNAGIGGGIGMVTGAAGGAAFGQRPSIPPAAATIPEQRATTDMAYAALRANPTRYDPAHFAQRANDLEQNFYTNPNFVTEREFSPASFRTLDRMREPPPTAATGGLTPGQIDLSRQLLGNADTRVDKKAAGYVRRGIDDFVENPPVGAILPGAGNAQSARDAAAQALLARQSHAGAERSQISENLRRKAEAEAGSRNSGLNVEAKLRTAYADFTKPNVKTGRSRAQNAGFNADEIGGMERFHSGTDTPLRNKIRYLGNLGGGGGGLGALAAGGVGIGAAGTYASDDPRWYGAIGLPVAGLALRGAGNRIARQSITALEEMIRSRNPTSQYIRMTQPNIPGSGSATNAKATRDLIALEIAKRQSGLE